ncbi:hypothetical protein M2336_001676 [Sphingobium sp. B1D7B]|uniref:portal protein n=1 Tax=Sphingobium sp. B1D7B TaxID=2940578 RepID=UPI002224FC5D|nr:hypothetical protein [Sphingobium sp. B1D7B]MCW2405047.1 hypothetical protein [Sphingobium sp. B1D7B]
MATRYLEQDAYGTAAEVIAQVGPEPVDYPVEFISWLQSQEQDAESNEVNEERKVALEFYEGKPFGNEQEGRSQVVTRDVAEVIDYMLASVLRTMVSGDRVVEFQAMADDDRDAVEQANEAVSQYFLNAQDGYRVLHDTLKSGLLEKTGAAKTFVEGKPVRRTEEVDENRLAELMDAGIQLDAAEQVSEEAINLETQEITPAIFRVSYVETVTEFPDVPIPNEELLVAKDARSLEEAVYHAHKVKTTVSGLRMKFGEVDEMLLDYDGANGGSSLAQARDAQKGDGYNDGANRIVWELEEYVRYDLDGDGIAELLRVQRCGRQIFAVEPVEYGLIEEWCPFPMAHRRIGQSLADKCMDIQLVRSVLLRQSLDNLYLANVPRMLVNEASMGDSTVDDLLTVQSGALVRWIGSQRPEPLVTPFVADSSFKALEFMSGERESRTGITRMNQGLDADTLNKTATGTAMMQAAGQQIEEYIARHFAEFLGRLFRKKYRLMRDYGQPFTTMIDGALQQVDPSQWPEDVRVIVRAGLGTNRKQERVQSRMMALQVMQQAAQVGSRTVTDENVYEMEKDLFMDMGLGSTHRYLTDPSKLEPAEEKPDPKLLEAQAKAQIEAEKVELEKQKVGIEAQLKQQSLEVDLTARREKAALDEQLARDKASFEAELALRQQAFEEQLAERRMMFEQELARQKAATMGDEQALPKKRPGGDLDK